MTEVVTVLVCAAIVVVVVMGMLRPDRRPEHATLATSLGILGTFAGVAWVLLNFDVQDVDNGIAELMSGMEMAFVTSVAGIFGSVVLRTPSFLRAGAATTGRTTDDVAALLQRQNEVLQAISSTLSGGGDSTLLTQLQLIRQENGDNSKALRSDFADFAKRMADNNSKALIDALREVIRDFNAKINEQFGENFKELNEGVGRMLDWQEQYKAQIETNVAVFNDVAAGIGEVHKSLQAVREQTAAIGDATDKLADLMLRYDIHQTALEERLQGFKDLGDQAASALPTIQQTLDDMTRGLHDEVTKTIQATADASKQLTEANVAGLERLGKAAESQERAAKALDDAATQVRDQASQSGAAMEREVERVMTFISAQVGRTLQTTESEMNTLHKNLGAEMTKLSAEQSARILKQIDDLDKALEAELTKSLQSLGASLASLSEKFAKDYTPLTAKLERVVRIADGLDV